MYGYSGLDVVQPVYATCQWNQVPLGSQCVSKSGQDWAASLFTLPTLLLSKAGLPVANDPIGGVVVSAAAWAAIGLWLLIGGKR